MAFSANLGGWIADTLVSKGLSVTTVRKVFVSFLYCNYDTNGRVEGLNALILLLSIFYSLVCLHCFLQDSWNKCIGQVPSFNSVWITDPVFSCADHANNRVSWPCLFPNSVEPC